MVNILSISVTMKQPSINMLQQLYMAVWRSPSVKIYLQMSFYPFFLTSSFQRLFIFLAELWAFSQGYSHFREQVTCILFVYKLQVTTLSVQYIFRAIIADHITNNFRFLLTRFEFLVGVCVWFFFCFGVFCLFVLGCGFFFCLETSGVILVCLKCCFQTKLLSFCTPLYFICILWRG